MAFEDRHPDDLAFPRQRARTRGGSLGIARTFTVAPDGSRVVFLRTKAGDDPFTCLWVLDVASGKERCVYDPREHGGVEAELTEAERARRERMRERARGVTAYACDRDVRRAVFVDGGRLHLLDLDDGSLSVLPTAGAPDDPRLSPDGAVVAYVLDGALHVRPAGGGDPRELASDPDPEVRWGLAEFIAAEELERRRGYWWSPDGTRIAAARVDERPVSTWWISEPSEPATAPRPTRYPQAGTPNALVTLHVIDATTGDRVEALWDHDAFEYLARVSWGQDEPLTLQVISRDQRTSQVLTVDDETGTSKVVRELADDRWLDLIEGSPAWLDGALVSNVDTDGTHRLRIGDDLVTPSELQVTDVIGTTDGAVWFHGFEDDEPTEEHVYRVAPGAEPERITTQPGFHGAEIGGPTVVHVTRAAGADLPTVSVMRADGSRIDLGSVADAPLVDPLPRYAELGPKRLRAALLVPDGIEPGEPVPVLLSPYRFPHFRQVVRWRGMYRMQQWFADRLGIAVLCIDGRGTPGGVAWEKAVYHDFSIVLDDQVEGLRAAAERWPFLDLGRVAMRGWSGGGVLSGLAVLKRPDVFHAAIAGAPVGDQRLYDTAYSERYLGDPTSDPEPYERSSLVTYARTASPHRRLLLMHGFADDNVFVANTLQLSAALLESGYRHDLVLLPNSSHMGGMEELSIAQDLAELDFLRDALALPAR
jgi:dipeptidyl-peptidase 4